MHRVPLLLDMAVRPAIWVKVWGSVDMAIQRLIWGKVWCNMLQITALYRAMYCSMMLGNTHKGKEVTRQGSGSWGWTGLGQKVPGDTTRRNTIGQQKLKQHLAEDRHLAAKPVYRQC
mmetsp:Transcript_27367/g.74006  ORF Transcript_27367/g.74006 Transcript_27367/m.74006 type:complete len:117 (+) Transcript_27367:698-1048(+)